MWWRLMPSMRLRLEGTEITRTLFFRAGESGADGGDCGRSGRLDRQWGYEDWCAGGAQCQLVRVDCATGEPGDRKGRPEECDGVGTGHVGAHHSGGAEAGDGVGGPVGR